MIYGASGFTGRLIASRAKAQGHDVVLAGRSVDRLESLAGSLGFRWQTVGLDDRPGLEKALRDVEAVLHVAGPFTETARPMLEACLRTDTHYLDVTGELMVFQDLHRSDSEARSRGVMVMPGVGFVMLASDCLAAYVAAKLPDAQYLRLGFSHPEYFSRGTLKTMISLVRERVSIRRGGRLTLVPIGRLERTFDYGEGPRMSTAVNWADVYTAYYTTGIPNIEVYAEAAVLERSLYQLGSWFAEPMRLAPWQWLLELQANAWPEGPSHAERAAERRVIVAEAEDRWRRQFRARLSTPDGYNFTAIAALAVAQRVLDGEYRTGFQTPASVYGPDFPLLIEGVHREDLLENSWT
ncbi:MAG: saccharopine dehydrogenase NADP-binding domain-containing protein [Nitrospirota bacterium]|nr:MAG: saccharopine dehydrogenase NADP-binding domain-containing protein [Nitrospirota bacterium]